MNGITSMLYVSLFWQFETLLETTEICVRGRVCVCVRAQRRKHIKRCSRSKLRSHLEVVIGEDYI
jgi:hypothetical protein